MVAIESTLKTMYRVSSIWGGGVGRTSSLHAVENLRLDWTLNI
jgi:hypothetical protein